jgi:subtilisin family serine protease
MAFTPGSVPTRCLEREILLDPRHSVALLEDCGDQYFDDVLWHLDRIDQVGSELDGRFDRGTAGAGSVVYVMDTGIRADHVEFDDGRVTRVIAGIDATNDETIGGSSCTSQNKSLAPCYSNLEELTSSSHGTAVASIIAGSRTGVAPAASLVSVRIMNERGLTTTATYMKALDRVIQHAWSSGSVDRTAIVNISGWVLERVGPDDSPTVRFAAVERKIREMVAGVDESGRPKAGGKRFFFVVAANNVDGGCSPSGIVDRFPATLGERIDGVVTVGGMTADNSFWRGGCRGGVEVLAPAQGIFSATITGTDHYRGRRPNHRSGTSFAAPIIAGIAARLLDRCPSCTPAELEATITSTPSRISNTAPAVGFGRVGFIPPAPSTWAQMDDPIVPESLSVRPLQFDENR